MKEDINIDGKEVQLVIEAYNYPKGTRGIATYQPEHSHGITVTLPDNTEGKNFGKPYGWFFCWDEIEPVTESMNKYNVEVGDTINTCLVEFVDGFGLSFNPLASRHFWGWEIVNRNIKEGTYKLTKTDEMNEKIIGYRLLKDTPNGNVGDIYTPAQNGIGYQSNKPKHGNVSWMLTEVFKDTKWFEPIYETKPTEIFVDTLAGKVRVTAKNLSINSDTQRLVDVKKIFKAIESCSFTTGEYSDEYAIKVETFKVGCKTFHVNDIPKLQEAIKQVS